MPPQKSLETKKNNFSIATNLPSSWKILVNIGSADLEIWAQKQKNKDWNYVSRTFLATLEGARQITQLIETARVNLRMNTPQTSYWIELLNNFIIIITIIIEYTTVQLR